MRKVQVISLDEAFQKAEGGASRMIRVKPHVRHRRGRMEMVRSFERMSVPTSKETSLPLNIKRNLNKDLSEVVKQTYFNEIPLGDLFDVCKKYGIVPIAEDGTEWSGFLVGPSATVYIDLAPIGSKSDEPVPRYKPFKNAQLFLSWYKMESGKYEVVSYVT